MTKEVLDSDRINYLIWRYLIESDYHQTAVRLQQEWNIPDPHQLPFAPHVQDHTLVSILNRGLLYSIQEREAGLQDGGGAVAASRTGFFGPLMPPSPAADEDFENVRKRQIDNEPSQHQSGPPSKKPRLSNGFDPSLEPTPMDVDGEPNGDENAYPSPEQAPSPVVATTGPQQGTQMEKVEDLSSDTVFLELTDDPSVKNTVLLQCKFHPQDPTIFAAAGTDALARMWTLSPAASAPGSESPGKPVSAPHTDLLQDNVPPSTTVTGLAWSSNGRAIAVASEPIDDGIAKVEFWHADGSTMATFNNFESPVICLRWGPLDINCLTISPRNENKETLITVIYPTMDNVYKYVLTNHTLLDQPLDAAWTSNEDFVVCGGDFMQSFSIEQGVINPGKVYETRDGVSFTKITFDPYSSLLAIASDAGTIDIWETRTGGHRSFNAHQGPITALEWQPLHSTVASDGHIEPLLASAGEDGAISFWNARSAEPKSKFSMTMGSAVMAIAFTPDGEYIAGGTSDNVFIWRTDDVHIPCASWARPVETGWRTPLSHDSTTDEEQFIDQFMLCWNANGRLFAYGVNSRLAVVSFRPRTVEGNSSDTMVS